MIAAATLAAGLALAAAPQRLALPAAGHAAVTVRNFGDRTADVAVAVARYRLDLRGRPLIGGPSGAWVRVAPARLVIAPRGVAAVDVTAAAGRGARPGDHSVVVTFTGATTAGGARVVARLGVVVAVRVPGRIVRRLAVGGIATSRGGGGRVLTVRVRNTGNVDVWLGRAAVVVRASSRGRVVAAWRRGGRRLLAGSQTLFTWRVPPRLALRLVRVDVAVQAGHASVRRRYRLRL